MKMLNILLGSSDRTATNRIEALLRDLCFERAMVECTRTARVDDLEKLGSCGWMDAIIFSPDNLLSGGRRGLRNVMAETIRAVRQIRKRNLIPFVAFGVSEDDKVQVYDAGVEVVLGPLCESDELRSELARILNLPAPIEK